MHKLLSRLAALVLLIALLSVGWAAYWYYSPFQAFQNEAFVEIEHGMSSGAIAKELVRDGVVRSQWSFWIVRLLHPTAKLQAGEYRFGSPQTPFQVFDKIRRGETFYEDLTVPEGSNIFDIANILQNGDTVSATAFLAAAADPASVRDLDPAAQDLEGFLFPSTYRVTHKTTAKQLCRLMTGEFRKQWTELSATASSPDLHRVLILASLVEKETALPAERPLVSAVFSNRLRINMPLQCDPTTVYAALRQHRYRGVIHKSDLASQDPYNTYAHAGLPPGAICNPGSSAIKAALTPASTAFLYFVAKPDGSGSHQFSETLDQHDKAVAAFRNSAAQ